MPTRLTDRAIAAAKPSAKNVFLFDSEVSGLAVLIYPSGRKVFVFDWREDGRQRRTTLGGFPSWTIGKARTHAGRMRLRADVGETVTSTRGSRVADLLVQWLALVALTRRPRTAEHYRHLADKHIVPAFGKGEPKTISRNAVEQWHGEIARETPIAANRALAVMSSFLSWLQHDRKIDHNPAKGIRKRPENQRHTFLNASEIVAAHAALAAEEDRRAALALRLALLTGCRIGETLSLSAEQIDASRRLWIKPSSHTKQRKVHIVPLQAEALAVAQELLQLGLPDYPACIRCWARVRAMVGRADVRIHDLRHSRASALARNGASLMQIGKVLGHTSAATTARYSHLVDSDLVDLIERT